MNMGIMAGSMVVNVRDCASFASLHVDPRAADIAPNMMMASSMYVKNHGRM